MCVYRGTDGSCSHTALASCSVTLLPEPHSLSSVPSPVPTLNSNVYTSVQGDLALALFASPCSPTSPAAPRTIVHPVPTPLCTGPSPGVFAYPHPHPAFRMTLKFFFLSEAFSLLGQSFFLIAYLPPEHLPVGHTQHAQFSAGS